MLNDSVAKEADLFQVWDRLAEHFRRKGIQDFEVTEAQVNDVLSGLLAQDMVQWEDDGA